MSRLVMGVQPVRELLRVSGRAVRGVAIVEEPSPKLEAIERLALEVGAPVHKVPRSELDRRAKGTHHQGVIAEAPPLEVIGLDELFDKLHRFDNPAIIVLDGIVDPQNFGAVVRCAVALGAAAVLWGEHASAPLSAAMFRASAGAVEHATLVRVRSLVAALDALKERGFTIVLLDPAGDLALDQIDLTGPVALVVGAEDRGAKPAVRRAAHHRAFLTMSGQLGSLNASVAAAIAIYESRRQRKH